ncbi:MAG: sigma factor-like helix-turn-helix DNA-binding protein [Lachnospiraceae bacterium]|nr:sigma factor-like helix-turn-helix DNA-binding protein [Lachnospiraceae bacterium]
MEKTVQEENEEKKQYLRRYAASVRREQQILDEIQRLRLDKMFPSVVNDDMPHSCECKDLSDYIVLVDEQIEKLKQERLKKAKVRKEIEAQIGKIDEETEQEVLRLRYIQQMAWEQVSAEFGYTRRHVSRIHGEALMDFKMS